MERGEFRFQTLISSALSADSFQELMQIFSQSLCVSICYKNVDGTMYVESEDNLFLEHMTAYPFDELCRRYYVQKVNESGRTIGHLFMPMADYDVDLIDTILLAIRVYHMKISAELSRKKKIESEILANFLTRKVSAEKVVEMMPDNSFPLIDSSMVAVIGYGKKFFQDGVKGQNALTIIDEKFERFFKHYIAWHEKRKIIIAFMLVPPMDETAACDFIIHMLSNVKEHGGSIFEDINAGFGTLKKSLSELPDSYDEAELAFRSAYLSDSRDSWWKTWRSLGADRLLLLFTEHPETDNFIEAVLGKLIKFEADADEHELIHTLENIEKNSWNIKQTSSKMHLHYNTLKYRYSRIQDILNMDCSLQDNRFNIALALRMYRLKGR